MDLTLLQTRLGNTFKDAALLQQALTHRSFAHESAQPCADNESLEFLGDAIGAAVCCHAVPTSSCCNGQRPTPHARPADGGREASSAER